MAPKAKKSKFPLKLYVLIDNSDDEEYLVAYRDLDEMTQLSDADGRPVAVYELLSEHTVRQKTTLE